MHRIGRFQVPRVGLLRVFGAVAAASAICASACSDSPAGPVDAPGGISGDAAVGAVAFLEACSACHTSRDGFDLAFFAFPDSTIVRRAVAHVDSATAHDIVSHIRTLRVDPTARDLRIFQPGDEQVATDQSFAARLFGEDAWPLGLVSADLEVIDPREVPIALPFPLWSFEESNLDWMPETGIAEGILNHPTPVGPGSELLSRYYDSGSTEDLIRVVFAFRVADRDPDNPQAPCVVEPIDRLQPEACFESRRWISTLVAQHMLRSGVDTPIHQVLHDVWWDVGNVARRSRFTDERIDNAVLNWAVWMYLGWAFEPDRHASVYLGNALTQLGLPRHATFHALRAQVSRGPQSVAAYRDAENAARFSPTHWTYAATRFGYLALLQRLDEGLRPQGADALAEASEAVEAAHTIAARRVGVEEGADLAALRDEILARLEQD
jgi:hypothetical protein